MGEVYRARDRRLLREVAIKILPEAFALDADRLRRFEQEARAVSALNHPNVLSIFDVGSQDGTPYLVVELLQGESLRKLLAHGPIPARRAVDYAQQIADGLAAAHDKKIVHRDLKPDYVFVTDGGRVGAVPSSSANREMWICPSAADICSYRVPGAARSENGFGFTLYTPLKGLSVSVITRLARKRMIPTIRKQHRPATQL
jgi:serine/threonine protein kinase